MKKALKYLILFFAVWLSLHTIIIVIVGLNDNVAQADAIVIFGNKVETDGTPSKRLQSRLDKGLELYNQGVAPLLIVSGGLGIEGYEEAVVMKEYLLNQGISEDAIIEDRNGYDTYQTSKI